MMRLKKLLPVIGLLAVGGILAGLYVYNKGPVDVKGAEAASVSAETLYTAFSTDSSTAQKVYSGKILEVSGEATNISVNQKCENVVQLKTNVAGAFINCTVEKGTTPPLNSHVKIKGICSGIGQGEEDLGIKADVYLTRCVVVQ